jgi:hypothetical protein
MLACEIHASIDYITVLKSDLAGKEVSSSRFHFRGAHATIHDPTGAELRALVDCTLLRLELAVDFRPRANVEFEYWPIVLDATHAHLSKYLWPFDERNHVYPRFGATSAKGHFDKLLEVSIDPFSGKIEEVIPRAPASCEVIVFGDRHKWAESARCRLSSTRKSACAQSKVYVKATDRGQRLPASQWSTRTEVTIWGRALQENGLNRVNDLLVRGCRNLRRYFFIFDPEKVPLPYPKRSSEGPGCKFSSKAREEGEKLFKQLIAGVGAHGIFFASKGRRRGRRVVFVKRIESTRDLPKPLRLGRAHGDVEINRRVGKALDNLTARLRKEL